MIDQKVVNQVSLATLIVCVIISPLLGLAFNSVTIALGLFTGAVVGLLPIVSWGLFLAPLMARGKALPVVLLLVAKLALYGLVFFVLIYQRRVNPIAFGGGITVATFMTILFASLKTKAPEGSKA